MFENHPFVVADVPGLIVGASEGKGLGHDFLKHLERTRILVHLIEVTPQLEGCETERDPILDFEKLNAELAKFSSELAAKKQIVVLNKCDEPYVAEHIAQLAKYFGEKGFEFHAISCQSHDGIRDLVRSIIKHIHLPKNDGDNA